MSDSRSLIDRPTHHAPVMYVDVTPLSPLGPPGPPGSIGPAGPAGPPGADGVDGTSGVPDEAPLDGRSYGRIVATWAPVLPMSGGVLTGPLSLAADPTTLTQAATKNYVDTTLRSVDAPVVAGTHFGRTGPSPMWEPVLGTTGGTMTGNIIFAATQIVDGGNF